MNTTVKESFANVQGVVGRPKKIGNNTFQYQREDGARVFRLHKTDIAVHNPKDGSWTLNSNGWRTVTTKARFNDLTPYRVSSNKGIWYVSDGEREVPYYDGITLPHAFKDADKASEQAKREIELKAKIKKFLAKTIVEGQELPQPHNGDCWMCLMFDQEQPVGERGFSGWAADKVVDRSQNRDTDHLLSHIEEHYMHGSLIVNAFRAAGYKDLGISLICYGSRPDYARVRKVVGMYLKRRLGLATC